MVSVISFFAFAMAQSTSANVPSESIVTATQYAGGDKVAIRWKSGHPDQTGLNSYCGYYPRETDGYPYYESSSEYAIFARSGNEAFQKVIDLGDSSDRLWYGSIPGLSETASVELQVRLKDMLTGTYCEPTAENASSTPDLSDVDHPPSFDHVGDVFITDLVVKKTDPQYSEGWWLEYRADHWASNFQDNDGGDQVILRNHVYNTPYGLALKFDSNSHPPSADLKGRSRTARDQVGINVLYGDALNVLQVCNTDEHHEEWVGSCSDEVAFISTVGSNAPGAENFPSFIMDNRVDTGHDYAMQEFPNWATNLDAGANATPSSSLQFHTLWVTNSALYEVAPWISYPSGSLRFKFKDGVSGTSRVYIALADWDLDSPENKANYIYRANQADLSPDHSKIQFLDISVGAENTPRTSSAGARGVDLAHAPVNDAVAQSTGGGGALGFTLLGLIGATGRRRRKA